MIFHSPYEMLISKFIFQIPEKAASRPLVSLAQAAKDAKKFTGSSGIKPQI